MDKQLLFGRLVAIDSLYRKESLSPNIEIIPALQNGQCQRCLISLDPLWQQDNGVAYC